MNKFWKYTQNYFLREGPAVSLCLALIVMDILLSVVIVKKVPYTEIDWKAYMEEVEGYESGERNYINIRGNTGPLVYPAGFLYIFSFLKKLTSEGTDIYTAQIIFGGIYILSIAASLILYNKSKAPAFCAVFLIFSKRVHSIFMLRMFNDCIAVLFGLIAVILFSQKRWWVGSIIYSLSVSVKMNMLLFAPGVLAAYLINIGYVGAVENIAICALVQLLLGYPFLSTYPVEYICKAFELSRVFFYKWTVNFKFLPEEVFLDKRLSILLLVLTVVVYGAFSYKWFHELRRGMKMELPKANLRVSPRSSIISDYVSCNFVIFIIFASNFIGIAFARSLHYQFYCWYFFTLPFLVFQSKLPYIVSPVIIAAIEYSFNVFPATPLSSSVLQLAHVAILFALWFCDVPFVEGREIGKRMLLVPKQGESKKAL